MSFEHFIAKRYLKTPREHRSISVITKLSIIGVSLGVMTLIVVLSVMNGFEKDLKGALQGANGHLNLYHYSPEGMLYREDKAAFEPLKQHPGILAYSPFTTNQALMMGRTKPAGSMVRGIDIVNEPKAGKILYSIRTKLFEEEKRDNTQELKEENRTRALELLKTLKPHFAQIPQEDGSVKRQRVTGIFLGSQLAKNLGVSIGDFVTLVSPEERITPMGGIPRTKRFLVTAYYESGIMGFDEVMSFIDIEVSQKIYRMNGNVTGVTIQLKDPREVDDVQAELEKDFLFPYYFVSWKEQNANLFAMFQLEKVGLALVLTLIILIAAFNIISSLIMLVTEKKKDIAILKAMGAKDRSILSIFVRQGAVIGLTGTVIGEILGLLICWIISSFDVVDLPPGVYVGNRIPVHVEAWQVSTIAVVSLIICFTVTLFPAKKAANLDPVEGLRNE